MANGVTGTLTTPVINQQTTTPVAPQERIAGVPKPTFDASGQRAEGGFFRPLEEFQLNQQGFMTARIPTFNERGEFVRRIERVVSIPDQELESFLGAEGAESVRTQRNIQQEQQQLTLSALRGELPPSSRFERLASERLAQETLGVQRGQGLGSTLGQQRLSRTRSDIAESREALARGERLQGQQLGLQQQQLFTGGLGQIQRSRLNLDVLKTQRELLERQILSEERQASILGGFGRQAGELQLAGQLGGAGISALGQIGAAILGKENN
jgi:hypothetical protein